MLRRENGKPGGRGGGSKLHVDDPKISRPRKGDGALPRWEEIETLSSLE